MGHERLGSLPKSKKWRSIVEKISTFEGNKEVVELIAKETIKNVRNRFENLDRDRGVQSSFQFLVLLSYCAKLQPSKISL